MGDGEGGEGGKALSASCQRKLASRRVAPELDSSLRWNDERLGDVRAGEGGEGVKRLRVTAGFQGRSP